MKRPSARFVKYSVIAVLGIVMISFTLVVFNALLDVTVWLRATPIFVQILIGLIATSKIARQVIAVASWPFQSRKQLTGEEKAVQSAISSAPILQPTPNQFASLRQRFTNFTRRRSTMNTNDKSVSFSASTTDPDATAEFPVTKPSAAIVPSAQADPLTTDQGVACEGVVEEPVKTHVISDQTPSVTSDMFQIIRESCQSWRISLKNGYHTHAKPAALHVRDNFVSGYRRVKAAAAHDGYSTWLFLGASACFLLVAGGAIGLLLISSNSGRSSKVQVAGLVAPAVSPVVATSVKTDVPAAPAKTDVPAIPASTPVVVIPVVTDTPVIPVVTKPGMLRRWDNGVAGRMPGRSAKHVPSS